MNELGFIDVNPIAIVQIITAYLLGSLAFGILVSRLFGLPDPRTVGSGNPGATNVLRSGKKLAAALTLLGDAFKGWFPVWIAMQSEDLMWVTSAVAIAVFLGHLYPVFYKFKGGKGVATALGVVLAISPMLALFLVLGHIAMIAGMLDPSLLGYKGAETHQMSGNAGHEQCDPAMHSQMMQMHQQMMGDHQKMMNGNAPSSAMPMGKQSHQH